MFEYLTNTAVARPLAVASLLLGGGYFFSNFDIAGLDQISVSPKQDSAAGAFDPPQTFSLTSANSWSGRIMPEPSAGHDAERPRAASRSLYASMPDSSGTAAMVTTSASPSASVASLPALRAPQNLRIATWALGGLNPEEIDSPSTIQRAAKIIRMFDVLAVQQLRVSQRDFVPQLLALASGSDKRYEYLVGAPQAPSGECMAFFFDANTIVTDRAQLYTVADPDNRLSHDPLVAWFRAATVDPRDAWTFSLVNVRIELPLARQEVAELPRIIEAVRRDGRREDDCLLAGLFQADDTYLQATLARQAMEIAVKRRPTDIFARHQTSNLIYNPQSTSEAIGRAGVLDFLRQENLSLSEAEKVSPYLPVYAEFSPAEGGIR